jgi:hypothetical protein
MPARKIFPLILTCDISMSRRNPADGPYYFWVRGPRRPEPQILSHCEFQRSENAISRIILRKLPLNSKDAALSLRQLATKYPAPQSMDWCWGLEGGSVARDAPDSGWRFDADQRPHRMPPSLDPEQTGDSTECGMDRVNQAWLR